jgi:hypothetical protein
MADINTPGWEGLNTLDVVHRKDDQLELDKAYARTFETEEGKKVLEHLKSKTLDQPTWIPGSETSFGFAREGQNSVMRDILMRIERAKNE